MRNGSDIRDTGVETKSADLAGQRIAVCVCGGIGAVECVKLIRELRRHGAEVHAFVSPSVERFVTRLSLSWAAGREAVGELGPEADHLDPFSLVLVVPATLNTIAKCATGVADNAVTLVVAGQLGRRGRLGFVPAMNSALAVHPALTLHRKRLEEWGARFLVTDEEEGRLKVPSPERVAAFAKECLA